MLKTVAPIETPVSINIKRIDSLEIILVLEPNANRQVLSYSEKLFVFADEISLKQMFLAFPLTSRKWVASSLRH